MAEDGPLYGEIVRWPCEDCRHLDLGAGDIAAPNPGPFCAAFPDGIPAEMLQGKHWHREPFPGDHGIQYEPLPALTTDKEVRYTEVWAMEPRPSHLAGYLWAGVDGSGGFWPIGQDFDAHHHWRMECWTAARNGFSPAQHLDYWLDRGGKGYTWACSEEMTAHGTADWPAPGPVLFRAKRTINEVYGDDPNEVHGGAPQGETT